MPAHPARLHIRFFAILREQAGCAEITLESAAATPALLYADLQRRYPVTFPAELLRVAVNGTYAEMDAPLADGDRVVFIPPVAGG